MVVASLREPVTLFDGVDPESLWGRFRAFDAAHPEVYRMFRAYAVELRNAGAERAGAKLIWERMRWEKRIGNLRGVSLNNDYTCCYARLLAENEPETFGEFFGGGRRPCARCSGSCVRSLVSMRRRCSGRGCGGSCWTRGTPGGCWRGVGRR